MKKIFLSMLALSLTFGSFAQSQNKDQKQDKKEWRQNGNKEMQEKLNLTEAQKAQMKTLNENFRSQMQSLKADKNLGNEAQKQKRMELMKEHRTQVQSILTPEQKKQWKTSRKEVRSHAKGDRKNDMTRGKRGDHGKKAGQVAKDLNLSPDQDSRFKLANENFRTGVRSIRSNSTLNSDQKKEQMKSLHKKHQDDINSILSAEQKAKYKSNFKGRKDRGADKITK